MIHVQYHWTLGNKLLLKSTPLQLHDKMITTHWKVLHLARQTNWTHSCCLFLQHLQSAHSHVQRFTHCKAWHHSSALQITSYPLWSCILWLMWSFRSSSEEFRYVDTCLLHTRRPSGCWKKLNENFLNNYQYPFMKH